MDHRPIVLRASEGPPIEPLTTGMDRRALLDYGQGWAGWVRTEAGVAGGWHTHGERDSFIYVVSGTVTIEFGPGGRDSITANAGDFLFNPSRMVHREITAPDGPVEVFVVRVGEGPLTVNVEGPDHAK